MLWPTFLAQVGLPLVDIWAARIQKAPQLGYCRQDLAQRQLGPLDLFPDSD